MTAIRSILSACVTLSGTTEVLDLLSIVLFAMIKAHDTNISWSTLTIEGVKEQHAYVTDDWMWIATVLMGWDEVMEAMYQKAEGDYDARNESPLKYMTPSEIDRYKSVLAENEQRRVDGRLWIAQAQLQKLLNIAFSCGDDNMQEALANCEANGSEISIPLFLRRTAFFHRDSADVRADIEDVTIMSHEITRRNYTAEIIDDFECGLVYGLKITDTLKRIGTLKYYVTTNAKYLDMNSHKILVTGRIREATDVTTFDHYFREMFNTTASADEGVNMQEPTSPSLDMDAMKDPDDAFSVDLACDSHAISDAPIGDAATEFNNTWNAAKDVAAASTSAFPVDIAFNPNAIMDTAVHHVTTIDDAPTEDPEVTIPMSPPYCSHEQRHDGYCLGTTIPPPPLASEHLVPKPLSDSASVPSFLHLLRPYYVTALMPVATGLDDTTAAPVIVGSPLETEAVAHVEAQAVLPNVEVTQDEYVEEDGDEFGDVPEDGDDDEDEAGDAGDDDHEWHPEDNGTNAGLHLFATQRLKRTGS